MALEIGEADRACFADDQAKYSVSGGRRSELRPFRVRDPVGHEALEHPPVGREDADRGVARADHFGGDFRNPVEHAIQRRFGREGQPGQHEPFQSRVLRDYMLHADRSLSGSLQIGNGIPMPDGEPVQNP